MGVPSYSTRLELLPAYLFATIDEAITNAKASGVDVIDFGVGDPDIPTPEHIIEEMLRAVSDPSTHRYPSYKGMYAFREAATKWYKKRFGVELNPENEAIALIGTKEGLAHLPFAFLNSGEVCLVPDPAYPVYYNATVLADGEPYAMPLLEENGFLPDFSVIPRDVLRRTKLMFLNYPNNPTSAVVDKTFLQEVIDFAYEWDILVAYDNPYSEITFKDYVAPSILQIKDAREIAIEYNSLSKTYRM
ncbi:MAG: aminotransferase class I/II-fold pyridoxal phosphate-dependent enzyme, partial [Methermicoccaceae archaeon]